MIGENTKYFGMAKNKGKILVVDDNKSLLNALELLLTPEFDVVHTVSNPNVVPAKLRATDYDVVLLDMNFSAGLHTGNEGIYWLREIQKWDKEIIVILITAFGDVQLAVKAMKEGAADFILKPWEDAKLIVTLKNAVKLKHSKREVQQLKDKQTHLRAEIERPYGNMLGESNAIQEVFKKIQKVAKTDANVLILGENGTGKELVAREIHRQSLRADQIMLSVDLGALSETLFESELFGYTRGAFTDAKEDRAGRFETASGGTLFLDEIGNISLPLQSKLLTVLENRKITRLGSVKETPIDIRLISATNRDLKRMVQEGKFREDLLYRMNTIEIILPPLREREDDVILLADHYLNYYAGKYNKPGFTFSTDAYKKLITYSWPGNVRELRHTIEKAVILAESDVITKKDMQLHEDSVYINPDEPMSLEDIERKVILNVLKKHNGNHSYSADELKIARSTLLRKLKKYELT